MINWKDVAIDDLEQLNIRKTAVKNLQIRIDALIITGDNPFEVKKLELVMRSLQMLIDLTESGINILDNQEKMILDMFYINRKKGFIVDLCRQLGVEHSMAYRLKDKALDKYLTFMFGINKGA